MVRSAARLGFIALAAQLCWGCATAPLPVAAIPKDRFFAAGDNIMPPSAARLSSSGVAAMPPGFISFCLRQPDQCPTSADPDQWVILDQHTWQTIQQVNEAVNQAITPEDDERHYGRAEYWAIPVDGYGDCEDYALMKRKQLMEAGLPVAALRIAIVDAPREGRHAVLTVTTDQGDYVLDNLRNAILAWNDTGYVWIERQDPARAMGWASLESQPPQRIAAAGH